MSAKCKHLAAAITGTAVLLLSSVPAFAQGGDLNVGIAKSNYVRITSLPKLLGALIGVIFVVAFIIALFMLFWGGLQWIMSGGDAEGVETAQKRIQAAIIGLVVIASVYALFSLVGAWLGFDITNLVIPDALDKPCVPVPPATGC